MGKRGPKAVDFGLLNLWEFEFYKAFHLLRDGRQLPEGDVSTLGLTSAEIRPFLTRLKRMSPEDYWLASRRVAVEFGEKVNLKKPPHLVERAWAEQQMAQEIFELERALKPIGIVAQERRRKIWKDLVRANTYAALRKACGRWARLTDVRVAGMQPFPGHVLANAEQFLLMKQNKRFPRSAYSDNARLEYLARGMAGVLAGKSPATGIERLRNMKHGPGGPLWVERERWTDEKGDVKEGPLLQEREQYCSCWRCRQAKMSRITQPSQTAYANGLRLFMEIAAYTKAPREWRR